MTNQIVILAAGQGKRMGGQLPKVLISVKDKPLILYLLEEVQKIELTAQPVLVVGYKKELVRQFLGEKYTYAVQEKQLGTGSAVKAAKYKVKAENVLVLYGDMPFISAPSLKKLIKKHIQEKNIITMFTAKPENFDQHFSSLKNYGRIVRDGEGKIKKITEYKDCSETEKQIREVNPGIYMFQTKWLWENIDKLQNKNAQGEYYLTDLLELAIKQNLKVESLPIEPKEVLGVNSPEDLLVAEKMV